MMVVDRFVCTLLLFLLTPTNGIRGVATDGPSKERKTLNGIVLDFVMPGTQHSQLGSVVRSRPHRQVLKTTDYWRHFETFPTVGGVSGQIAFEWAQESVPFIDLPDYPEIERAYYYRWKVFREHIRETGCARAPLVVTECRLATYVKSNVTDYQGREVQESGSEGCVWGDKNGVILAAVGHHVIEGRWLRTSGLTSSYLKYAYKLDKGSRGFKCTTEKKRADVRVYTSWPVFACWQKFLVDRDLNFVLDVLPALVQDVQKLLTKSRVDLCHSGNGSYDEKCATSTPGKPKCYFSSDGWDAMEGSVSGGGCRPSVHASVFGEVRSLSNLLQAAGFEGSGRLEVLEDIAADVRENFLAILWNKALDFFTVYKTLRFCAPPDGPPPRSKPLKQCGGSGSRYRCGTQADVRELLGLGAPWMFGVVPPTDSPRYEQAWASAFEADKFAGAYGLRTAERAHACYNYSVGRCSWNAASWPYETSRVLAGAGELLQPLGPGTFGKASGYTDAQRERSGLSKQGFTQLLNQYARQHTIAGVLPKSNFWQRGEPLVSENMHPDEGYWIDRSLAHNKGPKPGTADRNRAIDYLHSTFCDLVLAYLFGLRPQPDGSLVVNPLLEASSASRFAVDRIRFGGHDVAIVYDPGGSHYGKGCTGFCAFVDGAIAARAPGLQPLSVAIPPPPSPPAEAAAVGRHRNDEITQLLRKFRPPSSLLGLHG